MSELKTISLKQLYLNGVFDNVGKLRVNSSQYPFVTLIKKNKTTGKNTAQNVYFSQESGKTILANFEPRSLVGQAIAEADVAETTNEAGETRYKLCLPSEKSNYETKASMESMFGTRADDNSFDMKSFEAGFTTKEVAVVEEQTA